VLKLALRNLLDKKIRFALTTLSVVIGVTFVVGTFALTDSLRSTFGDLAEELQLDARAFGECLRSDRHAEVVSANLELGEALGVGGTPTVFVHRGGPPVVRLGGSGFLDIQQAIEGEGEN